MSPAEFNFYFERVSPAGWYYESDGGGWYENGRHVRQPKTHYLTGPMPDGKPGRIDCQSKSHAKGLLREWWNHFKRGGKGL